MIEIDDPQLSDKMVQWQHVIAFFDAFLNPDRSIKRGMKPYAKPEDFREILKSDLRAVIFGRLDAHALADVSDSPSPAQRVPLWVGSPFPGLRAFTPKDAPIFLGRGRETDELVTRLAGGQRFIFLIGASGSGKSSLLSAGLLPRLTGNAVEGSKDWLIPRVVDGTSAERSQWVGLRFTPGELGDDPFLALAAKLSPMLPGDDRPIPVVAKRLESDAAAFSELAAASLENRPAWSEAVMFVDQFEELFSIVAERHRAPFLQMLVVAVQTPRVRILATLRAEFYHRCLDSADLAALLTSASIPLARPGVVALSEMMTGPAARAGLAFEEGLIARVLDDTGNDPGALALLAFALHELYEARSAAGRLTHAAYDSFGGVRGAIGRRAEDTFARLQTESQSLFRALFRELVEVNDQGLAARRRVPRQRLASSKAAGTLIDAFTDARLLVTDRIGDGEPVIDVAHEALLREWPRLATWISSMSDDLRLWRQTEAAAREWDHERRIPSLRWPHERLQSVQEAAERLGIERAQVEEPMQTFIRPESDWLVEELERSDTTHYRRAEIGDRLERIGDRRPGVDVRPGNIPDIVWCDIAGGRVKLEDRAGTFDVTDFLISKYPVTYRQFNAFIDDPEGYANERWWQGLDRPSAPMEQYRPTGNCPAENVSWHDAMAYCRWLSAKLERDVTLPTEWEWQQMATGGSARRPFPWGKEWDASRANSYESRLSRSTAVGMYPHGQTAAAIFDVAGNVWEWCLNPYDDPGDTVFNPHAARVLRGGSWADGRDACRGAGRFRYDPGLRLSSIGFRVRCSRQSALAVADTLPSARSGNIRNVSAKRRRLPTSS
jgi:formylglycine-generating enzyme required for sulfatase activity/energy-coupling factor transporter ATP-binding protein EcfA2